MSVTILIPARGGSRRCPRKNIRDLCGKPLLAWSIETALQADVGEVHVSTEDEEISAVAIQHGANVIMRRHSAATDRARMSDVVRDYMEEVQQESGVLLLQPTTPIRTGELIRSAALDLDVGLPVRTVLEGDRRCWIAGEQHSAPVQTPTVFGGFEPRHFDATLTVPASLVGVQPWEAIDIDTEDDFALAEFWMKRKGWV